MYDLVVKYGRVIDPFQHLDCCLDVGIIGNRIAFVGDIPEEEALQILDAHGCLVVPGLVDFHVHVFWGGADTGCPAELLCLPHGVTTAVDAGSAGTANFYAFSNTINNSFVRIKAQINVSPIGVATRKFFESVNPAHMDREKLFACLERHGGVIIGLKIRIGKGSTEGLGLAPLKRAVQLARETSLPLVVHTSNQASPAEEVANCLAQGDVYCHVYQGEDNTILDSWGKVRPGMREARERGVLFDAARGMVDCSFRIMRAALDDGFPPDIISSDLSIRSLCQDPGFSLPYAMSCFLNMGMSLEAVVECCTATPARHMGMEGQIGTLRSGAFADVAILELQEKKLCFYDGERHALRGDRVLVPKATVKDGRFCYRCLDMLPGERKMP